VAVASSYLCTMESLLTERTNFLEEFVPKQKSIILFQDTKVVDTVHERSSPLANIQEKIFALKQTILPLLNCRYKKAKHFVLVRD